MAHSWTLLETMDAERFLAFSQSNRDRLRMFGFKLTSCRSAIARDERVTIPDGVDLAALRTGVAALDMVLYMGRDIETLEWTEEPRGDWVMRATLLRFAQRDLQEAGLNPGEPSVELQQRYHEISGSKLPEI